MPDWLILIIFIVLIAAGILIILYYRGDISMSWNKPHKQRRSRTRKRQ